MPKFRTGKVVRVRTTRKGVARLVVEVDGQERNATAFVSATGRVSPGDRVVLNTTATDLELGSGGEDFVLWNLERDEAGELSGGHIVKLRYTPWQTDVMSAESPESPFHDSFAERDSLESMPVVCCALHSQAAAAAIAAKHRRPDLEIAYVMTDGAALPIAHSDLVSAMQDKGVISQTITTGHCFGGDLETVNVFSGLLAARHLSGADIAVVSVGPGVVGTSTAFGHTGIQQGQSLSAAGALSGAAIAALRISFADARTRHTGVSHHSLTSLTYAAVLPVRVAVPRLRDEKQMQVVMSALENHGVSERHQVMVVDVSEALSALEASGIPLETMGRRLADDPEFFEASAAAGFLGADLTESQP